MKCEACQGKGFIELEHGLLMVECEDCDGKGEIDGNPSNSGIERDNQPDGSTDSSEPKRTRKPKAKKKARARTS